MPRQNMSINEYAESRGIAKMLYEKPKNYDNGKPQTADENKEPKFLQDTEDYVQLAEECIKGCCKDYKKEPGRCDFKKLTNTKMQGILSMVNNIYEKYIRLKNEKDFKEKDTEFINELRRLRVRLVYESGRESQVMQFVNKAKLVEAIRFISKRDDCKKQFIRFTRYTEALVAYHRYYNRDKN